MQDIKMTNTDNLPNDRHLNQGYVYPDDATFPTDCCSWRKDKQASTIKCCIFCGVICDKEKHYHRPKRAPKSKESFGEILDDTCCYCSPHCMLSRIKSQRIEPQQLYHKLIHEIMTVYYCRPCWVQPAMPIMCLDDFIASRSFPATHYPSSILDEVIGIDPLSVASEADKTLLRFAQEPQTNTRSKDYEKQEERNSKMENYFSVKKTHQDMYEHIKQGHIVELLGTPFYIPHPFAKYSSSLSAKALSSTPSSSSSSYTAAPSAATT
jgi:hypothetical protein